MKKSLKKKVIIIGVLLIAVFVLLNIILTYFLLIPFSAYLSQRQMEKIVLEIAKQDFDNEDRFRDFIEEISDELNTQVTIVDSEQTILFTTRTGEYIKNTLRPFAKKIFNENFDKLQSGASIAALKELKRKEHKNTIQVILVKKIGDDRYAVLTRSYRSLQKARTSAIVFDLLSGFVIILISIGIIYRVSQYLVIPIRKMTETAEHISNLEFDTKVTIDTEDELGQLGKSINKMSEHLEENVFQLQDDIEKRKRLVRNLSHEIKSPVAVIMGYSDRMKAIISKDPEKALKYCEIISNESNRVDMIVREMLEYSRIEQSRDELNLEYFTVDKLFEDIRKRFYEENFEKSIEYIEAYEKGDKICADYLLIERAIYNLVNNAVAHCGELEQKKIHIHGKRNGEYYEIRVYNSGTGIEESELKSIWEPFSKVDKVRTRGKQGYGIGLSIVREIIEAHEGYYDVENHPGGIEFMIAIKSR